jgi:hypothetical protein
LVRPALEAGDPAPVLDILERELTQNLTQLSGDGVEQAAYFLAYDLVAQQQLWVAAEDGALVRDEFDTDRSLDVDVRVGSATLDNSHSSDGDYGPGNGLGSGLSVSLNDEDLSSTTTRCPPCATSRAASSCAATARSTRTSRPRSRPG